MTFDARENSVHSGNPVELYEFNRGTSFWRHVTHRKEKVYNLATYTPEAIRRTEIRQGQEINKQPVKIAMRYNHAVPTMFMVQPPGIVVTVTISRYHDDDGEVKTIFKGRITRVIFKGMIAELECESVFSSLKRSGLRRHYQTLCPHVLYGSACGLNREAYKVTGTASAIAGTAITVAAASGYADGYFKGGYLQHNAAVLEYDARIIMSHTGDQIVVASPLLNMPVGADVWLFPGCNHTIGECDTKFGNSENHGGYPFRPDKNPFNTAIF